MIQDISKVESVYYRETPIDNLIQLKKCFSEFLTKYIDWIKLVFRSENKSADYD